MPEDALTQLLGEALRDLVLFIEQRPEDATADDDVRALEDVAHLLGQVASSDRTRNRRLLGDDVCSMLGWDSPR